MITNNDKKKELVKKTTVKKVLSQIDEEISEIDISNISSTDSFNEQTQSSIHIKNDNKKYEYMIDNLYNVSQFMISHIISENSHQSDFSEEQNSEEQSRIYRINLGLHKY